MGRLTKQKKEKKQSQDQKEFKNQDSRKQTIMFIIGLVLTGIPYASTTLMFLLDGIIFPPSSSLQKK